MHRLLAVWEPGPRGGGGGGSFTRRSRQPGPHPGNPRAKGEKEESGKRFRDLVDVAKLVSGPGMVDILRLLLTNY